MGVHVEESRQKGLPCSIDSFRILRRLDSASRPNLAEAISSDDYCLIITNSRSFGIEETHVFDCNRMRRMPRQVCGETRVTLIPLLDVNRIQLIVCLFPAFAQDREPGAGRTEKMILVVKPDGLRLERQSGNCVVRDMDFLAVVFERQVGYTLEARFTRGQEADWLPICFLKR